MLSALPLLPPLLAMYPVAKLYVEAKICARVRESSSRCDAFDHCERHDEREAKNMCPTLHRRDNRGHRLLPDVRTGRGTISRFRTLSVIHMCSLTDVCLGQTRGKLYSFGQSSALRLRGISRPLRADGRCATNEGNRKKITGERLPAFMKPTQFALQY
jgi:hypothetical protein